MKFKLTYLLFAPIILFQDVSLSMAQEAFGGLPALSIETNENGEQTYSLSLQILST